MRLRRLPLALILLLLVPVLAAAEGGGRIAIPLFYQNGVLACRGAVDGRVGVVLIDSGSTTTCLFANQAAARRYRYRAADIRCATAGGTRRVRSVVRTARFAIAGCTYRAADLLVLPDGGPGAAIGLLGCDFMRSRHATIDLAGMRLLVAAGR